jgi:hypothetical protein
VAAPQFGPDGSVSNPTLDEQLRIVAAEIVRRWTSP